MSVSVSMPQLGESVTEGTVTRWLKKEGERVEADEPLLEVSTDKVDTEIPSPVSGILRGITVAEDETVAVGAELAVIDESADGEAAAPAPPAEAAPEQAPPTAAAQQYPQTPAGQEYQPAAGPPPGHEATAPSMFTPVPPAEQAPPAAPPAEQPAEAPAAEAPPAPPAPPQPAVQAPPAAPSGDGAQPAAEAPPAEPATPAPPPSAPAAAAPPAAPAPAPPPPPSPEAAAPAAPEPAVPSLTTTDGPYVTPLVRKLASEHGVDLAAVAGTGVGGRIRKQDVLEAARAVREAAPAATATAPPATAPTDAPPTTAPPTTAPPTTAPPTTAPPAPAAAAAPSGAAPAAPARAVVPSNLRGTTERMSRARQLIARRMVESLQTSAQLTTVVEVDVTEIARLRERAKADFEAREGVKLTFLPFFALATVEALKVHPRLNALIDTEAGQVTYHDAEHLGIAVDTERGLMVPVIRNAGDLNIGGLARKIADLAERTRAGQVSPDDLTGGTFTLTNTGSRKALFDTPIINQPQVGILGTGAVVKRPVVVEDPALGEVITVRSMVYLALTYDHRLIDGADAARFLTTVKDRLEEGAFESELGL